jgi:hypothetical protein
MKAVLTKVGRALAKTAIENAAMGPLTIGVISHWQLNGASSACVAGVGDNINYLGIWAAEALSHFKKQRERRFAGFA